MREVGNWGGRGREKEEGVGGKLEGERREGCCETMSLLAIVGSPSKMDKSGEGKGHRYSCGQGSVSAEVKYLH